MALQQLEALPFMAAVIDWTPFVNMLFPNVVSSMISAEEIAVASIQWTPELRWEVTCLVMPL
jgi:hypothetical protein